MSMTPKTTTQFIRNCRLLGQGWDITSDYDFEAVGYFHDQRPATLAVHHGLIIIPTPIESVKINPYAVFITRRQSNELLKWHNFVTNTIILIPLVLNPSIYSDQNYADKLSL